MGNVVRDITTRFNFPVVLVEPRIKVSDTFREVFTRSDVIAWFGPAKNPYWDLCFMIMREENKHLLINPSHTTLKEFHQHLKNQSKEVLGVLGNPAYSGVTQRAKNVLALYVVHLRQAGYLES